MDRLASSHIYDVGAIYQSDEAQSSNLPKFLSSNLDESSFNALLLKINSLTAAEKREIKNQLLQARLQNNRMPAEKIRLSRLLSAVEPSFSEVESLEELVALLRSNLEQQRLLRSSARAYRSRFNQFATFIESRKETLKAVGPHDLLTLCTSSYLEKLRDQDANTHTINNFLALFRLLSRSVGAEVRGLYNLPTKKGGSSLSQEELLRFLQTACNEKSRKSEVLARIFLTTDIRLGECARLKTSDLIWTDGSLFLRVAGRNENREVPVSPRLAGIIQSWLRERSITGQSDSEFLFPGNRGEKMSTSDIDRIIREIGGRCGLVVCTRLLKSTFVEYVLKKNFGP